MTWAEITGFSNNPVSDAVWVIPPERRKIPSSLKGSSAWRPHRVPLTPRCLEILAEMDRMRRLTTPDEPVFSGMRPGSRLSPSTLDKLLDRMKMGHCTVHGMRSSFKDWASELTTFPNELSEMQLGHVVRNQVERAYRRQDMLDRRSEGGAVKAARRSLRTTVALSASLIETGFDSDS
jgi:integrase